MKQKPNNAKEYFAAIEPAWQPKDESKEVKEGLPDITKGKWEYTIDWRNGELNIQSEKGAYIATVKDAEANSSHQDAKAICTAVNETYGKGYNPAAMEELYNALQIAEKFMTDDLTTTFEDIVGLSYPEAESIVKKALHNAKS